MISVIGSNNKKHILLLKLTWISFLEMLIIGLSIKASKYFFKLNNQKGKSLVKLIHTE